MMRRVPIIVCLVLMLASGGMLEQIAAAQSEGDVLDLANVPLTADALPEPGYQILTGGYLDRDATVEQIASPRNAQVGDVEGMLINTGTVRAYVLNLVLLEDRAHAGSDILSLVQTTVYLFVDVDGATDAFQVLSDYSSSADAEEAEPAIVGATTVRLSSQSGDTYRSVARSERAVIEVVSLETFDFVDADIHRRVVADSYDRLVDLQSLSSGGIAPQAVLIGDGDNVTDLMAADGTGVHQLYRVREGEVQAAAGELRPPAPEEIAPGLTQLYVASQGVRIGQGTGFYSSWIGQFGSDPDAAAFVAGLPTSSSTALLPDPYYSLWADEQAVSQGVTGVYRVSGAGDQGTFSGTLEIRQHGAYVVGIGWRTLGSVLPSVDVTSRLMDAQLTCLEVPATCAPLPLEELLPVDPATPAIAVPGPDEAGSDEFGWSLPIDPQMWSTTEEFAEAGYDFIELQSGRSLVTVESVIDQHGDPQQCVVDELRDLQDFEEHAVIELGSDVAGERPAGMEAGHAWAVYTVEPLAEERADQEYTIRIDCYTLVEGSASLIMTHRAPRYEWEGERLKGEALRDALQLPSGKRRGGIITPQHPYNWRWIMIDKIWIGLAA